jgi:hypothetical protein
MIRGPPCIGSCQGSAGSEREYFNRKENPEIIHDEKEVKTKTYELFEGFLTFPLPMQLI